MVVFGWLYGFFSDVRPICKAQSLSAALGLATVVAIGTSHDFPKLTNRRNSMTKELVCAYCGEELPAEPLRLGDKVYCCDACAFEAGRSQDCGGRTDSTFSEPVIEMPEVPDSD
jgi:hypothetical protein